MVPVEPTMEMLDEFDSIIDYGAEDSKKHGADLSQQHLQGDEVMVDTFRADSASRCERKTVTTEVELVSYVKERSTGNSEARYVKHSNQKTVLEQGMVINRDGFGNHQASIIITDFPGRKPGRSSAKTS
jgi:hypothetical protein